MRRKNKVTNTQHLSWPSLSALLQAQDKHLQKPESEDHLKCWAAIPAKFCFVRFCSLLKELGCLPVKVKDGEVDLGRDGGSWDSTLFFFLDNRNQV